MDPSKLDDRIVEEVRAGNTSNTRLYESLNGVSNTKRGTVINHAQLDRRLQVLRNRGRLIWTGSATRSSWAIPQEPSA